MIFAETVFQSIDSSVSIIMVLLIVALIVLLVIEHRVAKVNRVLVKMDQMKVLLEAILHESKKQSADLAAMRRYYEVPAVEAPVETVTTQSDY